MAAVTLINNNNNNPHHQVKIKKSPLSLVVKITFVLLFAGKVEEGKGLCTISGVCDGGSCTVNENVCYLGMFYHYFYSW